MKKRFILIIISLSVALCVNTVVATDNSNKKSIVIKHNKWNIKISPSDGSLIGLSYAGEKLINRAGILLKTGKGNFARFKLKSYHFSKSKRILKLERVCPGWELSDIFTLDSHNVPGLLERSFQLKLGQGISEAKTFTAMISNYSLDKNFRYLIPGTILGDPRRFNLLKPDPQTAKYLDGKSFSTGNARELKAGTKLKEAVFGKAILTETPQKTTLAFLNDNRRDRVSSLLDAKSNSAVISIKFLSQGWALANQTQNIGSSYILICPYKKIEKVLDFEIPKWYNAIKATSPDNRPKWVDNASIYEINTRFGLKTTGFKHISALIPRVKFLGFNTLYIQPVRAGKQGYVPTDYFKLSPIVGTPEEYRKMLEVAKANDIRILQDIVPHGSMAKQIKERGNSALWLWYDRKGNCGKKFILDYKSPGYLKFMHSVADFYMKNFKIDGFRIDQPYGSGINWRRKGFPARNSKPANIDVKWFRSSLDKVGGVMPPLPYERASLPYKQGGFDMVDNIRNAVKANRSRGAVLAELISPMFGTCADIIYDLFFVLSTTKFNNCEAKEFAPALARYYHERQKCSPPGTRYLRELESHDSLRQFPFFGTGAGRAAFAASLLARGVPMIFQYSDIGHGRFMRNLHKVRNFRPEFSNGEARYLAVKSSRPEVWTVLRRNGKQYSIGLVNFSHKKLNSTIQVPVSELKLNHNTKYTLVNVLTKKIVAKGKIKKLAKVNIKLKPFEVAILSSYPANYQVNALENTKKPSSNGKVSITESSKNIMVKAGNYSTKIDKKNGLINSFTTLAGEEVIKDSDLLLARRPDKKMQVAEIKINNNNIKVKRIIGKGVFTINYQFMPDHIKVDTALTGHAGGEFAALLLPVASSKNGNWKVNTIDGPLNDSFDLATQKSSLISFGDPSLYRDYYHDVSLWDNDAQIIDPSNPLISCFAKSGNGFALRINDSLRNAPANMALFQQIGKLASPAVALYYHTLGPLAADADTKFSFTLRPALYSEKQEAFSKPVKIGDVTLSSESTGYIIKNKHYRLRLRRLSGAIRELKNQKTKKVILQDQKMICKGIAKNKKQKFSNIYDINAGARIWVDGDTLRLRFLGGFQTPGRWNRASQRTWVVTEFAINNSGAFRTAWYFDVGRAAKNPVELFWETQISASLKLKQGNGTIRLFDKDEITAELCNFKRNNIKVYDKHLKLFMYNGKGAYLPRQYKEDGCTVIVNNKRDSLPKLADSSFLTKNKLTADNSLEIWGAAFSVVNSQMVPNRLLSQWPGLWAQSFSSLTGFDNSVAATGNVSLRIRGANVLGKNTLYYTPSFYIPLVQKELKAGEYIVKCTVRAKKLSDKTTFAVALVCARENGSELRIKLTPQVKRNCNWTKVELPITLKEDVYGPCLNLVLTEQYNGMLWVDDVEISKMGK